MADAALAGTLPPGFRVGHWTHPERPTGVSVVVPDVRATASVDVRGGAPASRETDLLAPWRLVDRIDALLLAGGSAFGLGAAHGVVEALAARGRGHDTSGGRVPIVSAAALFDLPVAGLDENGVPHHPPVEAGALAYAAATGTPEWGCVGAGRGATVGKQAGRVHASAGGIGAACLELGPVHLGAVAAVNALGEVVDSAGTVISGCRAGPEVKRALTAERLEEEEQGGLAPLENTTLVALLTDAPLDKPGAYRVAIAGHDGLGLAIRPAHTRFDGDSVFVLAAGVSEPASPPDVTADVLGAHAAAVVAAAVRHAVSHLGTLPGGPEG